MSDDHSIENEDRSGRSMELDFEVLRSQREADPYQTTRELAVTLGESVHNYSWIEDNRQDELTDPFATSSVDCRVSQAET
nr:unnamed protein product [Haemonchus contortus]